MEGSVIELARYIHPRYQPDQGRWWPELVQMARLVVSSLLGTPITISGSGRWTSGLFGLPYSGDLTPSNP